MIHTDHAINTLVRWAEVAVTGPPESYPQAIALLEEIGCTGVGENEEDPPAICGFLPVSDGVQSALDLLDERIADNPALGLTRRIDMTPWYTDDPDLAREWKMRFRPLEVGRRLVIKPSWDDYDGDPSRLIVELDPDLSFGTGAHPSTRLALVALEDYLQPGAVVADIGTGTGILSIAAARLGAEIVHATDLDPNARDVAAHNVRRNGVEDRVFIHGPQAFEIGVTGCDLIVANILAHIIISLAPSMFDRLAAGGTLITSGIRSDRLGDVCRALESTGFDIVERRFDGIWRAVIARKPEG